MVWSNRRIETLIWFSKASRFVRVRFGCCHRASAQQTAAIRAYTKLDAAATPVSTSRRRLHSFGCSSFLRVEPVLTTATTCTTRTTFHRQQERPHRQSRIFSTSMFQRRSQRNYDAGLPMASNAQPSSMPSLYGNGKDGSGKGIQMEAPVARAWRNASGWTKGSYIGLVICLLVIYSGYKRIRYSNGETTTTTETDKRSGAQTDRERS